MENSTEEKPEEREKKMADRVRILRETHEKLRERAMLTGQGDDEIEELENVPAYVRKKVPIEQQRHSEDQEVSRYRLSDESNGEDGPKLKSDNSYLHDNVD